MSNAEEIVERLVELVEKEKVALREVIQELHHIADELVVKTRDMRIAKTSFGVGGIVSSALTIAGLAAVPFTFGASLGLTIAGITLGVSCGAGTAATHIAGNVIQKKTMKTKQQKIDDYMKIVSELNNCVNSVNDLDQKELETALKKLRRSTSNENTIVVINKISDGLRNGGDVLKPNVKYGLLSGARIATSASHVGVLVAKTVSKVISGGTKVLKIGGLVLSVITVPLDIYSIVSNSINIHKNSPTKASQEIRRLAKFLTEIAEERDNEGAIDTFHSVALKYENWCMAVNKYKLLLLLLLVYGYLFTAIIIFIGSDYNINYGILSLLVLEISCFFLEIYIEGKRKEMWPKVKHELYEIISQNFSDKDASHDYSSVINVLRKFKQNIEYGECAVDSSRDMVLIGLKTLIDIFVTYYTFNMTGCTTEVAEMFTDMIPLEGALAVTDAVNPTPQCLNPYTPLVFLLTAPLYLYILVERAAEMYWGKKSTFRKEVDRVVEDMRLQLDRIHDGEDNGNTL